jgi:hypothetical protein
MGNPGSGFGMMAAMPEGGSMSGTHAAGKPITAAGELFESQPAPSDRLSWPAAGLVILLVSAGLWLGVAVALIRLFD